MKIVLIYIVIGSILLGCSQSITSESEIATVEISKEAIISQEFSSPRALVNFVTDEENGYVKNKTIDEIEFSSFYKPTDYLYAVECDKHPNQKIERNTFEELQFFDLRIKISNHKDEFIKYDLSSDQQYNERIEYCSFGMQKDIVLIDGRDTLPCVLFHFERAFDVVPYGHFMIGFPTSEKSTVSTKTLIFKDNLFNKGIIKFVYPLNLLRTNPVLS